MYHQSSSAPTAESQLNENRCTVSIKKGFYFDLDLIRPKDHTDVEIKQNLCIKDEINNKKT